MSYEIQIIEAKSYIRLGDTQGCCKILKNIIDDCKKNKLPIPPEVEKLGAACLVGLGLQTGVLL